MGTKVRVFFAELDGDNESIQEALKTMVAAAGLLPAESSTVNSTKMLIESGRTSIAAPAKIANASYPRRRNKTDGVPARVSASPAAAEPSSEEPNENASSHGVTVTVFAGRALLESAKRSVELSPAAGRLAAALFRGFGLPIDRAHLMSKCGLREDHQLVYLAQQLRDKLTPLSLEVKTVRAVGILMRRAETNGDAI